MAACKHCGREMLDAASCRVTHYADFLDGATRRRVPYGSESEDWGAARGRRCGDCNVRPGGFHHPGCDVERCAKCGGQDISCACHDDGSGEPEPLVTPAEAARLLRAYEAGDPA